MKTAQFLARVVPPGNFVAIGYNRTPGTKGGFAHRFFPEGEIADAASFCEWASGQGFDAYHANASFITATLDPKSPPNRPRYRGERTHANVHRLKSFWLDLDVKRPGDKKNDPNQVYATTIEALTWLTAFRAATGLPRPNLGVNSGYGLHVYWILEDPITLTEWQPYADALKVLMVSHGFKGDPGITTDSARILRPPGTANQKVPGSPAPVEALPKFSSGDHPNTVMLGVLQPFVVQAKPGALSSALSSTGVLGSASATTVAALGGASKVSSIFQNVTAPNMNAAAAAGMMVARRPRSMAKIAGPGGCGQVAHSLSTQGLHDSYPLWYLGHLTLTHFCEDGASFVHPIGQADPRYTPADTDAAVAQIAAEVVRKGNGPPSCKIFERGNPAICAACPHLGRIASPWDLGVDDADLPERYRRHATQGGAELQVNVQNKQTGDWYWSLVVRGDVANPLLDWRPTGGHALTFDYVRAGKQRTIYVLVGELATDPAVLVRMFDQQGIHLTPGSETVFRGFLMAWIDTLIERQQARSESVAAFGWARSGQSYTGFAVGGKLYRSDGREEPAPGGDPTLVSLYQPTGTLAAWQQSADLVCKGRDDLQVIVASAFAAPLMGFTGHPGVILSAWSRQSGVGKSAAMTVAQGVWAGPTAMHALSDTPNSVMAKIERTSAMVALWDETRVADPDRARQFVQLIFEVVQGKGRSRMRSDTSLRGVGGWDTLLMCAANRPLMDIVLAADESTEAGALRVFEYAINRPPIAAVGRAQNIIGLAKTNYGRAGEIYGKWLAGNVATVKQLVELTTDALNASLGADQSERFYVAGMATLLTGARIATKLKLAAFDVPAMQAFLAATFHELRAARGRDIIVAAGVLDIEQVLNQYVAATLGNRLCTDTFYRAGPKKPQILWHPQDRSKVDVHIAQQAGAMRFNRTGFYAWARARNLSGPDLVRTMIAKWGAAEAKLVIGGGTGYTSGQIWCVQVPLVDPALADLLDFGNDAATQAPKQAVKAAPKLRGNQPVV